MSECENAVQTEVQPVDAATQSDTIGIVRCHSEGENVSEAASGYRDRDTGATAVLSVESTTEVIKDDLQNILPNSVSKKSCRTQTEPLWGSARTGVLHAPTPCRAVHSTGSAA